MSISGPTGPGAGDGAGRPPRPHGPARILMAALLGRPSCLESFREQGGCCDLLFSLVGGRRLCLLRFLGLAHLHAVTLAHAVPAGGGGAGGAGLVGRLGESARRQQGNGGSGDDQFTHAKTSRGMVGTERTITELCPRRSVAGISSL